MEKRHMEVGDRLRAIRESREISQEVLAERAGLHRNTIGDIERGRASATVGTLHKLADALGISVQELFASQRPQPIDHVTPEVVAP